MAWAPSAVADPGSTSLVSVASDGTQGNDPSSDPASSSDGRVVAFDSLATNLVAGDTNAEIDVFVRDRQTAETTRVSVASDGAQGSSEFGFSQGADASISADGRFVAFQAGFTNLVAGDTNSCVSLPNLPPGECPDIFVHDRQTGQTTRVSVASDHRQALGPSSDPSISANRQRVAFASDASNLVRMDRNRVGDVFVRDRQAGTTVRASVAADGTQANDSSSLPAISADGVRWPSFPRRPTSLLGMPTKPVTCSSVS
jgi:Tol biopolymer transport system component